MMPRPSSAESGQEPESATDGASSTAPAAPLTDLGSLAGCPEATGFGFLGLRLPSSALLRRTSSRSCATASAVTRITAGPRRKSGWSATAVRVAAPPAQPEEEPGRRAVCQSRCPRRCHGAPARGRVCKIGLVERASPAALGLVIVASLSEGAMSAEGARACLSALRRPGRVRSETCASF